MVEPKKRGRPRKGGEDSTGKGRSYWTEDVQVFFNDGWAWATELVEKEATPPVERCQEAPPLCRGREGDIMPILKGDKPIPGDMHPRRRAVLEKILKVIGHGRAKGATGATCIQRGRNAGITRGRQRHARRLKARKGISLR